MSEWVILVFGLLTGVSEHLVGSIFRVDENDFKWLIITFVDLKLLGCSVMSFLITIQSFVGLQSRKTLWNSPQVLNQEFDSGESVLSYYYVV
jgi:hypothetical protein